MSARLKEQPGNNKQKSKTMKESRTMKPKQLNLNLPAKLLGLSLTALSALAAGAQTWQTVLDWQLVAGKSAGGCGIAADPAGHVFTAGTPSDASGVSHGIALTTDTTQLAKGDLSAVWNLSDDTLLDNPDINPSKYSSDIYGCGYDSNGDLYSVGQLWAGATGEAFWYVRRSSEGGQSWCTLYEPDGSLYQYSPGQWMWPTGFPADGSGNIYVVGGGHGETVTGSGKHATTNITLHCLVRKSSNAGQTWTLVDDLEGPVASAAAVVPSKGVFVVGQYFPPGPWLVRKSITGDVGTWATVDGPIANATPHGVCGDSQGNIYVVGTQFIATGVVKTKGHTVTNGYFAWITRMSSDGGHTWSTVDAYTYAPNQSAEAWGIGQNSAGGVVVVGNAADALGKARWIVRTFGTSGWQTIDDFQLAPGDGGFARGVATDAAGNLLVTGGAQDATGSHWIVRQLAP
jgi:hypothetical protein